MEEDVTPSVSADDDGAVRLTTVTGLRRTGRAQAQSAAHHALQLAESERVGPRGAAPCDPGVRSRAGRPMRRFYIVLQLGEGASRTSATSVYALRDRGRRDAAALSRSSRHLLFSVLRGVRV